MILYSEPRIGKPYLNCAFELLNDILYQTHFNEYIQSWYSIFKKEL